MPGSCTTGAARGWTCTASSSTTTPPPPCRRTPCACGSWCTPWRTSRCLSEQASARSIASFFRPAPAAGRPGAAAGTLQAVAGGPEPLGGQEEPGGKRPRRAAAACAEGGV
ncbi:unnamed protein product [Prorocentrum cordatum]|uniref:Uncharacterized protein n=1 Tax=Prorocentrum cordatum TaxID=2364126 RepID=A0ABN9XTM8_9DINO|nr:unnamed protein product [Polarella glacialis]